MKIFKKESGFTLIEILVSLGIIAVLSVATIATLNPAELIAQARDSSRVSDLGTIHNALGLLSADVYSSTFGTSSVVYISIPDTSPTCDNVVGLPALASSTYHCSSPENYRKTDGTGWVPVNFSGATFASPLSQLPVDPNNIAICGLYYTYTPRWEMSTTLQSSKYRGQIANYGTSTIFAIGKDAGITPPELMDRACAIGFSGGGDSGPLGGSGISADLSTLGVDRPNYPANGTMAATTYTRILDTDGVAIEGAEVECLTNASDGIVINQGNLTVGPPDTGLSACQVLSTTPYENLEISARARIGTGEWVNITQKGYVRFDAPPTVQDSSISASSLSEQADGVTTISWTLTALNGVTPVENVPTNCDVTPPGDYTEGMTITGDGDWTNAQGQATCTIKTTHVGLYTLNFLMSGLSVSGPQVEFTTYTPPTVTISPTLSQIATYQSISPANGIDGITVYINIRDTENNPVEGATVQCNLTGDNNIFHYSDDTGITNVNGDMYCGILSTTPETKTFTAIAEKIGMGAPVELNQHPEYTFSKPGTEANSTISFSRASAPADGYSAIVATIIIRDEDNLPVENSTINCSADPTTGIIVVGDGSGTDINGQGICRFSSTEAEWKYITIRFQGGTKTASTCTGDYCYDYQGDLPVEFTDAGGWTAAHFTLSATSSMTGSDNPIIGQIEIIGADLQPVSGAAVHCDADPWLEVSGGGVTDANGQFLCTFWTDTIGTYTLKAFVDSNNLGSSLIEQIPAEFTLYIPGDAVISPSLSKVFNYTTTAPADNFTHITTYMDIRDNYNNPVEGATVECSATGNGNTMNHFGGPNGEYGVHVTNADGGMYCELGSTDIETKTFTATAYKEGMGELVTLDQHPEFTFTVPGDPLNSDISFNRATAPADGYSQIVATITVRDAQNNPVPDLITSCSATNGSDLRFIGDGMATDANGQVTCRMSSTVAESMSFGITFSGSMRANTCSGSCVGFADGLIPVEFTDATGYTAATFSLSATESYIGELNPIVGQITVIDADSNPVPNVPVFCAANPSQNMNIAQNGPTDYYGRGITDANGIFTCAFWTNNFGSYSLQGYSFDNRGDHLISEAQAQFGSGPDPALSTATGVWDSPVANHGFSFLNAPEFGNYNWGQINIVIKDSNGSPIQDLYPYGTDTAGGQTYNSALTGDGNYHPTQGVVLSCGVPTSSQGEANCAILTRVPGTHTVKIYEPINNQQIGSDVVFEVAPNGGTSQVSAANSSITITGTTSQSFGGWHIRRIDYNVKNEENLPVVGAYMAGLTEDENGVMLTRPYPESIDQDPSLNTTDADGNGHVWLHFPNTNDITFHLTANGTSLGSITVSY